MNTTKEIDQDIFGVMDQLNKQYEEKFLKEIHPLIKKYYQKTGNDLEFKIPGKVCIKYDGAHYWVYEGDIMASHQSGLWFDEVGHDIHGRKYDNERDGWFYLVARLCCKYHKEIKEYIEFNVRELMK